LENKIELTVALPMYRSKEIGWLAFEGLIRQENINFEWEIIVIEEKTEDAFKADNCMKYFECLNKIGCTRLEYQVIDNWIPLSKKWLEIAKIASNTSKYFLLQASDCYPHPTRLSETYKMMESGVEWYNERDGIFYDLKTGDYAKFIAAKEKTCGLNMCTKTEFINQIKTKNYPDHFIDGWLQNQILKVKKDLKIYFNRSDNWHRGFDTTGQNNITPRADRIKNKENQFNHITFDFKKEIPKEIIDRLREFKGEKRKSLRQWI